MRSEKGKNTYFDTKMAAELGELPGLVNVELPEFELGGEHDDLQCRRGHYRMPVLEMMIDSDEDLRSTRSERSRTPQREAEQDWIIMVEAEPGLVPVRQANQIQSAWVGEPKPFGKPERFGGDERRWTQ
jgi:hypothetical protein